MRTGHLRWSSLRLHILTTLSPMIKLSQRPTFTKSLAVMVSATSRDARGPKSLVGHLGAWRQSRCWDGDQIRSQKVLNIIFEYWARKRKAVCCQLYDFDVTSWVFSTTLLSLRTFSFNNCRRRLSLVNDCWRPSSLPYTAEYGWACNGADAL